MNSTTIPIIPIVVALNMLMMFISGLTYPLLPLYLAGYTQLDVFGSGLVMSLASLIGFISSILWGISIDRSRRGEGFFLVIGSVSMASAYFLATCFSSNTLLLILFYTLSGIGSSAVFVTSATLVSDISSSENLGRNMGFFWASGSLGWAIPLLFSGYLVKVWGIAVVFLIDFMASIMIVLLAVNLHLNFRRFNRAITTSSATYVRFPSLKILMSPQYLVFYITALLFVVGDIVKNIYIPQYYAYEVRLGIDLSTFLLSIASWFEIPIAVAIGYLIDRTGAHKVYTVSLVAMSVYMLFNALFVHDLSTAFIAMASYSIVWGSYSTSSSILAVRLAGEDSRAVSLGLLNSNFPLANILFNPILGYVAEIHGYRACFLYLSFTLLTSMIIFKVVSGYYSIE